MDIDEVRLAPVTVRFPRPVVTDVVAATRDAVAQVLASRSLPDGAEIGVTVGSRGIANIATIARAAIDALKAHRHRPFVIPAMGSHGGATATGQRHLLAHYGVTEEQVGAPIRDDMAARSLGVTPEGVEAFIAEVGWQADGVLLINRVKPHTDFKGPLESGLAKMCAIGLGKYEGARECHRQVFGIGLGNAIRAAAGRVIESGKILGGVAILENAYHETARIEAVALDGFFAHEERLLIEAKRLMGRLPLDEIDVLLCDRMGKNISGAGIDTNIIGRSVYGYEHGRPWHEGMPVIHRIVVRDLAEESDGNAVGMGMVDFVPRRFASKVNEEVTVLNATTARSPENAKWPIVLQNDRDCLRMALATSPDRVGGPLIVYVRDTLELGSAFVSLACVPLLRDRADIEIALPFVFMRWSADDLVSPFP
ncbi:MAG: hypothetical protein AABM32_13835 [Chloroflexota bacterium]